MYDPMWVESIGTGFTFERLALKARKVPGGRHYVTCFRLQRAYTSATWILSVRRYRFERAMGPYTDTQRVAIGDDVEELKALGISRAALGAIPPEYVLFGGN